MSNILSSTSHISRQFHWHHRHHEHAPGRAPPFQEVRSSSFQRHQQTIALQPFLALPLSAIQFPNYYNNLETKLNQCVHAGVLLHPNNLKLPALNLLTSNKKSNG